MVSKTSPVMSASSNSRLKRSSRAVTNSTTAIESSSGRLPSNGVDGSRESARSSRPRTLTMTALTSSKEAVVSVIGFLCSNQDLWWCWVAQEGRRAGGEPVGPGLEQDDQVIDLGRRN